MVLPVRPLLLLLGAFWMLSSRVKRIDEGGTAAAAAGDASPSSSEEHRCTQRNKANRRCSHPFVCAKNHARAFSWNALAS
jgi:hypothetical protein